MDQMECHYCHRLKPQSEFKKCRRKDDGRYYYDYRCRACAALAALKARRDKTKPRYQYSQAKGIAKRRSKPFLLSVAEYIAIRSQPCAYCGFQNSDTGMGIDQVDRSKPYVVGNVVSCCFHCNMAKGAHWTFDEMKQIGAVIRRLKTKRAKHGQKCHSQIGRPRKYDDNGHVIGTPFNEPQEQLIPIPSLAAVIQISLFDSLEPA
jgi:hypothetical protein